MSKCGLLDCGSGNLTSVRNALEYLGVDVLVIREAGQLGQVNHLVLPGVGAFPAAMSRFKELNILDELKQQVLGGGKWFLGICVGMQILADEGEEFERCAGLGFIDGRVTKLRPTQNELRIPHMGCNELDVLAESPLFAGLPDHPSFYFVHSYAFQPTNPSTTVATCDYGQKIVSCVQKDNIFGVQFHPEKSQHDGLQLLKNFVSL